MDAAAAYRVSPQVPAAVVRIRAGITAARISTVALEPIDETELNGCVKQFLDAIAYFAEAVEVHYHWRPMLRDPGDEMVLETAVNGQAQAIVTFNRRDYADVKRAFGIFCCPPRH